MDNDYISEGEAIGWDYDDDDIARELGFYEPTEAEKMLEYHGYETHEIHQIGSNQMRRMWWAYRNRKKIESALSEPKPTTDKRLTRLSDDVIRKLNL